MFQLAFDFLGTRDKFHLQLSWLTSYKSLAICTFAFCWLCFVWNILFVRLATQLTSYTWCICVVSGLLNSSLKDIDFLSLFYSIKMPCSIALRLQILMLGGRFCTFYKRKFCLLFPFLLCNLCTGHIQIYPRCDR